MNELRFSPKQIYRKLRGLTEPYPWIALTPDEKNMVVREAITNIKFHQIHYKNTGCLFLSKSQIDDFFSAISNQILDNCNITFRLLNRRNK